MRWIRKPEAEQVGSQHPLKNRNVTSGSLRPSVGVALSISCMAVLFLIGTIHPPVASDAWDTQCSNRSRVHPSCYREQGR